ncbi:MAG: cyclic nucleotide-binding domain-containing protein [Deltaproteobacteria bacterium]|nr:cyclic nucleotide-binding domain-containing protein [Deltaproteobacteria bacterium]
MPRVCPVCGARFDTDVQVCPADGNPTYRVGFEAELVGRKIDGRFAVLAVLGSGGMGTVLRARQLSTDRDVAVKLLRRDVMDDEQAVRRFFREARTASRLTNPHTISIYDFGQDQDGTFYIAMELLRGRPLTNELGQDAGPLDPARAIGICREVLESLEEAHAAGVYHRDLKPDNIFLLDQPPQFVKVLDFGIAKLANEDEPRITSEDQAIGTPEYMSPEQASGREADGRADIYSLGVILFALLSGRLPFESNSAIDLLLKKVRQPAPRLSQFVQGVPPALEALVGRLLETDPARRPATAADVRSALGRLVGTSETRVSQSVPREEPSNLITVPPGPHRAPSRITGAERIVRAIGIATRLVDDAKAQCARFSAECSSPPGRRVFSLLVEEALSHAERLRLIKDRVETGRDPAPEIESIAATDRDLGAQFERWVQAYAPSIREDARLADALDECLRLERQSLDGWERVLAEAETDHERRLVRRLLVRGRGQVGTLAELKLRVLGVARGTTSGTLHSRLAGLVPVRRVRAGEVLISEGEPGDTLVVVVSGRFRVEVEGPGGQRSEVGEIGPGDTVGEMTCIDPAPRSATVVAVRDSEVCEIDRVTLKGLRDGQADVYVAVMRGVIEQVTGRVRETDARIAGLIRQLRVHPDVTLPGSASAAGHDARFDLRRPASTGILNKALLTRFEEVASRRGFIDRTWLCREGEPGTSCFLVVGGQVEVVKTVDGQEEILAVLIEGSLIGQIALADGRPRTASVRAKGYVVALELERATFDRLVDEFHPLALRILEMLAVNGIRQLRMADRWLATLLARHAGLRTTPTPQEARAAVQSAARKVSGARPRDDDDAARRLGAYMRAALREWGMSLQQLDEIQVLVPGERALGTDVRAKALRVD